jgi:type I restriction enzyme S subunit
MVEKALGLRYKMTEIGEIPNEWEVSFINKTSLLKGRIGWQGLTTKEYLKTGDYYLVTGTEFKDGAIDWHKCNFVSKERYDQDSNIQIKINDILVTKDGTIGKVAFVDSLILPATLNSGVFVIRPVKNSYYPKFLYYILQSKYFKRFIGTLKAGSTISHLYQYSFSNFAFPNPPLLEQQKIAKILSDVDDLIESLDALISKKKNIKQGLMQKLLTRGIGHTRFKMTEIGEIPAEWHVDILGNMVELLDSRRIPLSESQREVKRGTIPYCGANGVIDYIDDYIFEEEAVLLAEDGGYYGKYQNKAYIMNGKYWVNNHAHIFKGKSLVLENRFILYWLNLSDISAYISGTTRKKLNQERLKEILVPRIPLPEQQKIAEILSDADREIEALEQKRDKYKLLKTGMMQQLLTGRIRVK